VMDFIVVRLAGFEPATFGSGVALDSRPSLSLNDLRSRCGTVFHGIWGILFPIGSQFVPSLGCNLMLTFKTNRYDLLLCLAY
jgi:hypothetical protein